MGKLSRVIFIPVILAVFFAVYFQNPHIILRSGNNAIFLTISTFLFSIFAGFFIAQQRRRHTVIRENIAHFDGVLSFIYRSFIHFEKDIKQKLGEIIARHYEHILASRSWNYHIINQSDTLSRIHKTLNQALDGETLKTLKTNMLNRISAGLLEAQIARKNLLILHRERISGTQWTVIYFLFAVLLISLHTIPSDGLLMESLLKASFATALVYVMILMHQLNTLALFESTIGESSARDILSTIKEDRGE